MTEICRIFNRQNTPMLVSVEPWGKQYDLSEGCYLSIHIEENTSLIEFSTDEDGITSVYLNDCVFDDLATEILRWEQGLAG
jgi:hypothetical protein